MNKSSRQYQRGLTTNSFNQDFIYYKYSRELQKSPKLQKHALSYQQHESNNHSKIQSMKNTLDLLMEPTKGLSKSFNKSVIEIPTGNKKKSQIIQYAKSVQQESIKNVYNNKLELLTSKMREIAEKSHFSSVEDPIKKDKSKRNVCKTSEDTHVNTMDLIHKKNQLHESARLQEFIARQTNIIFQKQKQNQKIQNYSQQLVRSNSKSSGSFYKNEFNNDNSQSSSLRRQPKNSKNDKTINSFNFAEEMKNEFQLSHRPRGKTVANILYEPIINEIQSTKIKINTYLESKQPRSKRHSQNPAGVMISKINDSLVPTVLNVLQPHRGPITSIIINSDGKRFLTASNDYTIKESTLEGTYTTLRKHQGRVNVMRMIDDKLYSGGNDCKLKFQKGSFTFQSPVVDIYPEERQHINVGTSSTIQMFDLVKKTSTKKIEVRTKWYKIFQKVNKDIYVVDNHNLSIVDWRVPYPLINLSEEPNFIEDWVSDPYSLNFYQVRDRRLIQIGITTHNSAEKIQQHFLNQPINDYCWKKDKTYFLTQSQVQVFQNLKNNLRKKTQFSLNQTGSQPCKLQIKNEICIYGMLDGKLVVNKLS